MSDVNANIHLSIDSSQALGQLRALQNQISAFNQSVIAGNVAAAQAQRDMTRNLTAQINATKGFTTSITNVESSVSRLGRAIDKNKLSLGEYFRYGIAASGTFGKSMKEHGAIMDLAADRVKRLQTQYVALSAAQNGYTKSMAIRPTELFNAQTAVSIQRQQIFHKLLGDGSTALVNWGKNTQWAGRQLMVGFTVPLTIFGGMAGKIFMDLEKQVIQFKRVYGDLQTPTSERNAMVEEVKELAKEFTKYGIAVSDTVGLAAKAAATGAQGADLIAATTEATRLATLGQIDYQQALDATISLQTAFGISSKDLAEATNFLNAVENQTVTSLDDVTQAIPLVAPVIKGLGGDVRDLAIFMTAMREGGISANEGANALKSGLASLINPTKAAREQLEKVGINIDSILSKNKGDLRGLVSEFGDALGTLGKFERQQTLAKMFGKYQFARMGALFANISKEGSQAARVMDLTALSAKELGQIAEGELGQLEQSVGVRFTAAVEKLKLAIAPIGEAFLKIATPIIEWVTKIAEKFNELPDAAKTFITWGAAIGGVLIPTVIMLVGLLGNFAGNILKMGTAFARLSGRANGLSSVFQYLTTEELDAMAASASLEGQTHQLTSALNVQRGAVSALASAYSRYVAAAGAAASGLPQGFRTPRRMATGGFVGGTGNKDSEPALLMPGEFVVTKSAAEKYGPVLSAMNAGTLKGYADGTPTQRTHLTSAIPVTASEALAGEVTQSTARVLGIIKKLEETLGRSVSSIQKVSNLIVEMPAKFNNDMKAGIEGSKFRSEFSGAGVDKYAGITAFVKEDFDQLRPHLEILDREIIEASKEFDVIGDSNIGEITKKAFERLPQETREALAEIEKLSSEYHNLRISVQNLDDLTDAEAAKLRAAGISVVRGQDKDRQYISQGGVTASVRSRQETRSKGRTYRRSRLFGLPATAAADMASGAVSASAKASGVASPSKITMQQGKDIAKGMQIGIEQGTAGVVATAEQLGEHAVAATEAGVQSGRRGRRGATRPQGPPDRYDANGVRIGPATQNPRSNGSTGRFNDRTMPMSNPSRSDLGFSGQADESESRLSKFNGKIMGGMMAMDGMIMAMSMMDNSVGQFAQKIMPAAFAAQGVAMMLPMLANPIGIAVAAIAAFGAGFAYLAKQSADLSARAQGLADAMIASTDVMNNVAEVYGRQTIVEKMASKEKKREYGVTKKQDEQSQEFISSEVGQSMKTGLAEAMGSMGASAAASQFANNLSSMVMQGAMGPKQARALALAMGDSLGNKTFGIKAAAELESIIGPDGQDITKKPLKVAIEIDRNNKQFINSMSQNLEMSGAASAVNSYALNMGQDSIWGSFGRGLRGLFDDNYEQGVAQLQAAGAVIGNQMSQAYDNLTAAKARYADISAQAESIDKKDADAKAEAEAAARKAQRQTEMLTQSIQRQKQAYLQMFRDQGTGTEAQSTMLTGMEQSILKKYEEDPIMKTAWDAISGKLGSEVNGEARFQIYAELQAGTMDPMTMQNLIGIFGNTQSAVERYLDLTVAAKGDSKLATELVQGILGNNLGQELTKKVMMDARINMSPEEMKAYNDLLVSTSQIENEELKKSLVVNTTKKSVKEMKQIKDGIDLFLGLPEKVQKSVEIDMQNPDDFQEVGKWYNKFKSQPDIEKKIFARDRFSPAFEAFGLNYDAFNALPNISKALIMKYVTAFMTYQKQYDNAEKLARDSGILDRAATDGGVPSGPGKGALMDMGRAAQGMANATKSADDVVKGARKAPKVETPKGGEEESDPEGSGSGGGGGEKSWIEQQMESLLALEKLYTTAGKQGGKLVKQKGFFFGVMEKLRTGQRGQFGKKSMPTIPQFMLDALGDGPEGLKNAMTLMNMSESALKQFIALNKKVAVGQFVENKRQEIQASKQRGWVKTILEKSGVAFSKEEIDEILSDQDAINAILFSKGKKRAEVLKTIRQGIDTANTEEFDYEAQMNRAIQIMDDAFEKQEDAIEKKHQKIIDNYESQIKANQKLIDTHQKLVDSKEEEVNDYQRLNDLDQQKIDDYNRQIELEQRKIDNLRREDELRQRAADAIQRELDAMADAEQSIRDAYQQRINALDAVAKLNERILQSQQDQLNISKALSEGDVYAAAQAAAEMQKNSAQFAADQNRSALEQGMENAVAGLRTSGGLTRAQAEAQIQAIQDQSYQTQLQIRDIEDYIYNLKQTKVLPLEDSIYQRNLLIRDLQNQIYDINELSIEPLKNQNDAYQTSIDLQKELLDKELEGLVIGGFSKEMWEARKDEMQATVDAAEDVKLKLEEIKGQYDKIAEAAANAAAQVAKVGGGVPSAPSGSTATAGTSATLNSLGIENPFGFAWANAGGVMKYAAGSVVGSGSRDTIPAMLTPGEYVIRKAMVDKYGLPMLEDINQGSFSMPRYSGGSQPSAKMSGTAGTTTVAPVYNTYSVQVNASTNASPDDIATVVINKIRSIDNMSVRRINGY